MHRPLRALVALMLPVIVLIAFATGAAAGGDKVDVCHWASHKYVAINVSVHALPAHLAHGDAMPDEYGDCP